MLDATAVELGEVLVIDVLRLEADATHACGMQRLSMREEVRELFDRAEVAGYGFVVAPAVQLDHRQIAETVADFLDAAGGFRELEAAPEHARRFVEAAALPMGVAEQPESHGDAADVVGVFEDPLGFELMA